jgi:hypothetical protein
LRPKNITIVLAGQLPVPSRKVRRKHIGSSICAKVFADVIRTSALAVVDPEAAIAVLMVPKLFEIVHRQALRASREDVKVCLSRTFT